MSTSSSTLFRLLPAFLVSAPLLLTHCGSAPDTWTDPNNAAPAAKLDVSQPVDASGHVAENPVGQPVAVRVAMIQTGPGTCVRHSDMLGCGSIGNTSESDCTVCAGPDTPLDFELTAIACDDDQCDVAAIQHDPAGGDLVTIVPRAGLVTVRATATSGSLTASGSVPVSANCATAPTAPGCQ